MNTLIENLHAEIDFNKFSHCEHAVTGISSCPQCCSRQYFYENEIDYSCEQKMKLYVLRYLPVHMSEVRYGIEKLGLHEVINKESLNVLSLGGGPGSDIMGFRSVHRSHHMFKNIFKVEPYTAKIKYLKIDINNKWDNLFQRVINTEHNAKLNHVSEYYECLYENATSIDINIDIQDVILLSYIVSELTDVEAIDLSSNIKRWSNEKTIILVNDRNQEAVINRVDLMFKLLNAQKTGSFATSGWARFSYPDEIRDSCEVKLNRSSMVSYAIGCP
ncbi:hypothetical protein [Aeromonas sp. R5-3]|uniref:hypothetical protein n=1 Tax=Aeromonas sp. R5-3 TaxID=3138469 RepID=UPI0034A181A2